MTFSKTQIDAAFQNAQLHGYKCPNDAVAIKFLEWYHANNDPVESVLEGILVGLSGERKNGYMEQERFWKQYGIVEK